MSRTLIENGRVVDPSQNMDRVTNVLIEDGKIAGYDVSPNGQDLRIDAADKVVVPGLIDMNVELQEPGWEEDETIATGTAAAVAGGYTTIACMPNTDPPVDTQAGVEFMQLQAERADKCNVVVVACVSKGREGKELAEMGALHEAGAVAFCDSHFPIQNSELLRRALEYCLMFDKPILNHPENNELTREGVMHEGLLSMILGLPGMPVEGEDVMTGRDIRLCEATHGKLHLQSLSSAVSVELLRRAKMRGVRISGDVSPHNFVFTDEKMRTFDANFKLRPPLRSRNHIDACIAGLCDGTIDVIASGHAPRSSEKKMRELDLAPFGAVALETTLALVITELIEPDHLGWPEAIAKLTVNPARVLGLNKGSLRVGADADVTIIDPHAEWTVDPTKYRSKSSNCPYAGREVKGRAEYVLLGGVVKLSPEER
jgi:dihydroorotase